MVEQHPQGDTQGKRIARVGRTRIGSVVDSHGS